MLISPLPTAKERYYTVELLAQNENKAFSLSSIVQHVLVEEKS
jgi:hypothetical protein